MADKTYKVGSNTYDIPEAEVQTFLSDFPDAVEIESFTVDKDTFDIPITERDSFLKDFPTAQPVKKKEDSETIGTPSQVSSEEQPPLEQPKEKAKRQPLRDLLRTFESEGLKALGGLASTPKHINRSLASLTMKPIMKLMGASDEEANQYVDAILTTNTFGQQMQIASEATMPLIQKGRKIEEKMAKLEGDIWSNIIKGKDGEQDLGVALEQFGRGLVGSVPMLIEVAATSMAGPLAPFATLSLISATTSAQKYAETEGLTDNKRLLNSWMYGGFEALGEIASGVIFRGIGKAFRQGMKKEIAPQSVAKIAKGIASAVGLEGSSEAITQIGQNFTAIVTGEDTERNLFAGTLDAATIGGLGFGFLGGTAKAIAPMVGRAMASDKEVSEVQENFKQQEVLINQLEQTDVDPVKEALKRNIKFLKVQSDLIMDENYELAGKLTPEQQNQVAELYSVWNQLQDKIDSGQMTEVEAKAMQKTVEGIKGEIKAIKDDLIKRLDEEKKAEKEAKVDEVKETQKTELDKLKEEETKKLDKVKDVAEGETVNKKKLDEIKETYDTKADEVKVKTEEEVAKIEEEYTEKEPTMEEAIAEENPILYERIKQIENKPFSERSESEKNERSKIIDDIIEFNYNKYINEGWGSSDYSKNKINQFNKLFKDESIKKAQGRPQKIPIIKSISLKKMGGKQYWNVDFGKGKDYMVTGGTSMGNPYSAMMDAWISEYHSLNKSENLWESLNARAAISSVKLSEFNPLLTQSIEIQAAEPAKVEEVPTEVKEEQPKTLYHSSSTGVESIPDNAVINELGIHLGSKATADKLSAAKGGTTREYEVDLKNPIKVDDFARWEAFTVSRRLLSDGIISQKEYNAVNKKIGNDKERELIRILKSKGYDGFVYDNYFEGGGKSYVIFDKSQIKLVAEVERPQELSPTKQVEESKPLVGDVEKFIDEVRNDIKDLPDRDFGDDEANANWKKLQADRKALKSDNSLLADEISKVLRKEKANQVVFEAMYQRPIPAKVKESLMGVQEKQMSTELEQKGKGEQKNWRDVFNETDDLSKKSDILRAIADVSKDSNELSDVLNLATKDLPDIGNILWAISRNPNSSQEIKQRALSLRDEVFASPVEPLSPTEGITAPPKVESVAKEEPQGKGKYRKTQINALIQDESLQQQEIAKIVDANKEKYTVLHQADAVEQAKAFIDGQGVRNATNELIEPTRKMADFPLRQVARQVLLDFYSRAIIDPNAKESDKKEAFTAIDKLQSITAREATKAGQGNALLQVWKSMQPSGLLEYVARKIATSNQKTLDRKIGDSTLGEQLDALYETLNEESKKIISDILAGKTVSMPKQEERPAKEPPKRKTVPKERIKKEQEYRQNLLDQYRKSEKPMAMAVTGLTSSQIELGGNLIASYIREGYYRMQDIVERLTKDLKSVDIDVKGEDIDEILKQPKSSKETLGEYIDKVESNARTRAGEKLISKKIADVVTEHWSVQDELKRTLAQKLVDEAGLTEAEAQRLEKEILDKFDKEIIGRAEKQLTKILGTTKLPQEKKAKGIVGKMVELVNMGALDEDMYRDLFAEKFNLVKLNDLNKEEILKLANNVQLASGKGWLERDATIRLAKYIFELYPESRSGEVFDTWIAMAYANMLAGPTTSILNMWSAGWNMSTKPIRDIANLSKWLRLVKDAAKGQGDIYNPFGEMFYSPMLRGSQMGIDQAKEVYLNGDLNNKYVEDIAKKNQFKVTQLERDKYGKSKRFKPVNVKIGGKTVDLNIFNAYKYSGRNLAAQDKFMLSTSYEVELAHILRDKLKNKDLTGRRLTNEVMSILRGDHVDMEELNANLEAEAVLYNQMTGEWMSDLQRKIRKREMMLDQLPITKEEKDEAERLARSNIFTDDRSGWIATLANGIGAVANKSYTAGLIVKPFIPFTKVVGNVAEYMLDHVPFYGFMRANGMSISYAKKLVDSDAQTAQMGERGSRAYYEQMGRAWLGTMSFLVTAMIFLGRDDEDFVELSGGYLQEGFKKKGRENVLPQYTLRIGNVKIPYKNIPALAIPLAIIGNVNDALKAKQDEGDVLERFTVALFLEASQNTLFMFKDMSFLDGAQRLSQIVSDIASTDETKWKDIGEGAIKSYLGFATRPLPQNNNAIQQIWKVFDPESYPQGDIKGMLRYAAGVQHFSKYTAVDQFGDAVTSYPGETLLPYTHWLKIKGQDERWKFLAKNNAIPNKIYNRVMQIETDKGIEKRKLEQDELYEYSKRAGNVFSDHVVKYMSDKENVAKREKEIGEREKANGEIEKISGAREDIEKLWADAKKQAETELFRWGSVKEDMPKEWELIKKNEAYLPYQKTKTTDGYKWTDSELYEFNNRVTLEYAKRVRDYLQSDMPAKDKGRDSDNDGIDNFQEYIQKRWKESQDAVERQMKSTVGKKAKAKK